MMSQQPSIDYRDLPTYSFDHLIGEFKCLVKNLPDTRCGTNTSYSIADAALGAMAVFFMQSPSFLAHQAKMYEVKGYSNARSLFQIEKIPSDNQIRNLLDPIEPINIMAMFDYVFNGLKSVGYFEHYRSINKTILIALDGVNYFSSDKIYCQNCNKKHFKNGKTNYSHTAITPVIVAPGNPRAISLAPEFITPQDGHAKQDGEHAAAKRWLKEHGKKYKDLNVTILGDDLYAHHPICEAIKQEGLHFILTCKPDSHTTLYKHHINYSPKIETLNVESISGEKIKKTFMNSYRFVNEVLIRNTNDAFFVNWCELVITDIENKVVFCNSYITDHVITLKNVEEIVKAGRTRWKIENENNNTLKNHGYHLEHNFGHGKQYLSQLLLTFNLLAFLFHTVLSIMDVKYQKLREQLPTRKIFFEHIKALTTYLYFDNWDALLQFMLDGLKRKFTASMMIPINKVAKDQLI